MKYIDLQRAFESKLNSIDEISELKVPTNDIVYWLNNGLDKFIRDRSTDSVQSNQVFTDDLSTLIITELFTNTDSRMSTPVQNKITISYKPGLLLANRDVYRHALGENVIISVNSVVSTKPTDVIECTIENISSRLNNSLSEHKLNHGTARPLRVFCDDKINLYTDGNYSIVSYELIYIKNPPVIDITSINAFSDYSDMPSHTHNQIVDNAVELFIQSLRLKSSRSQKESK